MSARLGRAAAHALIRGYQLSLSGLVGRQCRYLPTCSDYADEAISRHGLWLGIWMGGARVCRCHPWGGSGYEPVPSSLLADVVWWKPWRAARRRQDRARSWADSP